MASGRPVAIDPTPAANRPVVSESIGSNPDILDQFQLFGGIVYLWIAIYFGA